MQTLQQKYRPAPLPKVIGRFKRRPQDNSHVACPVKRGGDANVTECYQCHHKHRVTFATVECGHGA